jgi:Fur family ferric uptake transcriptional regulator
MNPSRNSAAPADAGRHPQQQAEHLLRQAQVRATDARLSVLALLLESRHALSHLELQNRLAELDRVTLYRALDCLTAAGLAHKIAGDDRVFRYSTGNEAGSDNAVRGIQHQHGHFKCTRCDKLFCLDDELQPHSLKEQLQATLLNTLGKGFQNHDIEVTIKGWCADCSK